MKKFKNVITIIFLFILYIYVANISLIPKEIVLLEGEELNLKKMFGIQTVETAKTSNNNYNVSNLEVNMFGSIPLKDVKVTVIDDIEVVPIGKIIGLKLYTNGVLVVGMSEIEDCNNNLIKPY